MLCRPAENSDLPVVADIRWRLKTDDAPIETAAAYDAFVGAFIAWAERANDYVHWVAEDHGRILGAMSVAVVQKPPAPGELESRWGYLTSCYVYPDARNAGVGEALLTRILEWARAAELEMLLVWPSERTYPFYERAGFSSGRDPLLIEL